MDKGVEIKFPVKYGLHPYRYKYSEIGNKCDIESERAVRQEEAV